MATFVLIHGAGDSSWYWHLVADELRRRGHDVVAPDLPSDDDSAGLSKYAEAVVDAIGDRTGLVVVAQSFGAFTAPLVCERVPVDLLVLVAGLVPVPGEAPKEWWTNTGYEPGREGEGDVIATLYRRRSPRARRRGAEAGTPSIGHADTGAVASRGVARRAHPVPALS
jgi:pimeloyl-ACP methyl ester carboxylesterase